MQQDAPVLGKSLPFRTINDVAIHFQDTKTCIDYITQLRWNGKTVCPFCKHGHVYELKGKYVRYKCSACRKHFSAIKGTIFENSTVPLSKWFMAIFILSTHRKGISSVQVARDIGVTQKTAWFMMQRVRNAFKMQSFSYDKLGGEGKPVEADETYIGGKPSNMHKKKREEIEKVGKQRKIAVIGAVERGGEVRARVIESTTYDSVIPFLVKSVHQGSKLMTDEHVAYGTMDRLYEHETPAQLKKLSYPDFLRSKYWAHVRKLVLKRDNNKCVICKSDTFLQIHHDTYKHHFNELKHLGDLMTLCRKCHKEHHFAQK